jgi:hypothetical protein
MNYPLEECVGSLLPFCDQIIIYDSSDGSDNTQDRIEALAKEVRSCGKECISYHDNKIDWTAPNHGVFDGQTKANARALCTGQYLWQSDSDEVVHEQHTQKILDLVNNSKTFQNAPLLALPVVEWWGASGKVRIDVNLWKWRLSKNDPRITHGIPGRLRKHVGGLLYSMPGSDSCNMIYRDNLDEVPCLGYVPLQIEQLRQIAVKDIKAAAIVERFVNHSLKELGGVFHYSWINLERKIKQYRQFWSGFWPALYGFQKENVFFPGIDWKDVTDDMIKQKAQELENGTTGWIFHKSWNHERNNGIYIKMDHPAIIKPWLQKNK